MARAPKQPLIDSEGGGDARALSEEEIKRTVTNVNRGRMMLAKQVRDLRLFAVNGLPPPSTASLHDHPLIQVINALRDELALVPTDSADPKDRTNRVTILRAIAELVLSATTEAHKASTEIQAMLARHEDFQQRKTEHKDKMDALNRKLAGGDAGLSDADLEELSLTGPEPVSNPKAPTP